MTLQRESGRQGGIISGEIRRLQARQRALDALGLHVGHELDQARGLVSSGALDAFLATLERSSYQRGYQACAGRQERAQVKAARQASRDNGRTRLLADLGAA